MANPPIDLPQPAFGVLIVRVFTAIAIACSPRYDLRHHRAVLVEQKLVLRFQALKSAGSDVVLRLHRRRVILRSSGRAFAHVILFHRKIQPDLPITTQDRLCERSQTGIHTLIRG